MISLTYEKPGNAMKGATASSAQKLSATQLELVAKITAFGGRMEYRKGGFWTAPGVPEVRPGVPEWYFGWGTVAALQDRGILKLIRRSARSLPAEFELVSPNSEESR